MRFLEEHWEAGAGVRSELGLGEWEGWKVWAGEVGWRKWFLSGLMEWVILVMYQLSRTLLRSSPVKMECSNKTASHPQSSAA